MAPHQHPTLPPEGNVQLCIGRKKLLIPVGLIFALGSVLIDKSVTLYKEHQEIKQQIESLKHEVKRDH